MSTEPWLARALDRLATITEEAPDAEPLKAAMVRTARDRDPEPLLRHWQSRTPGTIRSEARYRWELGHRIGVTIPAYAGPAKTWTAWRPSEKARVEKDPFEFEATLLLPIVLSEHAELLLELADGTNDVAALARAHLAEAAPILRRDFARYVQMAAPWEDTFALFCLTRLPRTLALLHPLAIAIAACYASSTTGGIVLGSRFPFHDKPLVSASAQLASALLVLGSDLELAAQLAGYVARERRSSGAWGDATEPDDVLTTLVGADLLARIDPMFDPEPAVEAFRRMQSPDGLWRALGPDAPWTTREVIAFVERARRPFAERFRWPHRADAMRDHKTGLPFFAYFADLADVFGALPGLATAKTEMAFIDLIGFRAFNNAFGQNAGDDVLAEFAIELERIPHATTIRDGGDEFVVIGAPTRSDLFGAMETMRRSWPARFRARFGADVPPVAPRILVAQTQGTALRHAREELGRGITGLKTDPRADATFGLLVDAGAL